MLHKLSKHVFWAVLAAICIFYVLLFLWVDAHAAEPFRLATPERDKALRGWFPRVRDKQMTAIMADPATLVYTEEEMPRAYQFFDGAFPGVHSPRYNISADPGERFGNANVEFPWGTPFGTHRCTGVSTFRFLALPRARNGVFWPVVYYPSPQGGYDWVFPRGTVAGEVLTLDGPGGYDYTFEVRARYRTLTDWEVDVFRPFPTANDLGQRIKQLRPKWREDRRLARAVGEFTGAKFLKVYMIGDEPQAHPQRQVLFATAMQDTVPALDEALVKDLLLKTEFKSCVGTAWREAPYRPANAPTVPAGFHIVPPNYDAGFIAVESEACAACHNTTNVNAREFNSPRDWYGRVRGCDGNFTFHIFEPGSISYNGYQLPVVPRQALVTAGIIAPYTPAIHTPDIYARRGQ